MNQRVPIVIPSYEPDENLLILCRKLVHEGLTNIIIVDDGSGHEYLHFFESAKRDYGAYVLRHESNKGKGRALKDAFQYILAMQPNAAGCVTADSDGQHSAADIHRVINTLERHPDALVLGCRDFNGKNVPDKSKFGNKLTRSICRFLCDVSVSDTQTGLRGISAAFMKKLLMVPGERFEFETNMLIATQNTIPIVEIPIRTIYDSRTDHKTHFHPIKDSIRIYKIFAKMFLKFAISSFSSSLIDIVLFTVLCAAIRGREFAFYIAVATVIARVVSASYNYMVNYRLVFHSSEQMDRSALKYTALAIVQMSLSALLVTIGAAILPFINAALIKMAVDILLFFVSYRIQQKFVFQKQKMPAAAHKTKIALPRG